jgi:hypothetical protein
MYISFSRTFNSVWEISYLFFDSLAHAPQYPDNPSPIGEIGNKSKVPSIHILVGFLRLENAFPERIAETISSQRVVGGCLSPLSLVVPIERPLKCPKGRLPAKSVRPGRDTRETKRTVETGLYEFCG